MDELNYHHLRLFWAVAREGNLSRAARNLRLTPQTVSTQIRDLESSLGETLFTRTGRRMSLTDVGRVVLGYAEEIFSTGRELQESLRGHPTERTPRIVVGAVNALPKIIVRRLIEPALELGDPVRFVCHEGPLEQLLADLSVHRLDVVFSDSPIPRNVSVRAYNHHLGHCGVSFMGRGEKATRLRKGFPGSLSGVPMLLPTHESAVRRELDTWFLENDVHPAIIGEFEDSALLKAFGETGLGVFPIPSAIEAEVTRQYDVRTIGWAAGITENFYAISVERRVAHPGVIAICRSARDELFA